MRAKLILVVLLSSVVFPHLFAAVVATYVPESQITLEIAPGPFTSDTVLGAKLGTFIITSTTGEIYTPSLVNIGEASDGIQVTGLMKDYQNGPFVQNTNTFYIISAAYPSGLGGEPVLQTLYNNLWPIIDWDSNTITQSVFYVEMYLVNTNKTNRNAQSLWRKAQFFKLDSPYLLPSGFNPRFSVAVAMDEDTNLGSYTNDDGTVNEVEGDYVVTDSVDGPDSTPIIGSGGYTNPDDPGSPGFYYGDVPLFPTFYFNFFEPEVSFSLESAFGSGKVTVNQAIIQVDNGVAGDTYTKNLTFTDTSTATSFQLFPSIGSASPIDYQLYLDNDPITKGTPFLWQNINPGLNAKDLMIGGINESDVINKVSGTYSGTITVTISTPN
ncbi:hypothetical protein [Sphaerochaeta globosa]|uniref:Uncharacterized protein n=1 Tax=Sphaerochaeta globosa (strain ATCC BAA-1886 / DSM 22777 / Buddy) TaxID=158189 RepID=F0RVK9_SPHGB|nr:hypothetical protein [Sphaerochaeta globosa]ADY13001.1 hypothetical protein SpiBuddy_1176 [Sphaerochaeta globosa str. Buddy]